VAYWLLYGALVVTPGFLVGAGRAPQVARLMVVLAVANLVLVVLLTPELGVEGPALATTIPFAVAFPLMLRLGLRAADVSVVELAKRALMPAYLLGTALGGALLAVRVGLEPETLPAVAATAIGGVFAFWAAFYLLVLDADERELTRGLVTRGHRRRG
jgi:O-antigen/teichoic acid export membrane protein